MKIKISILILFILSFNLLTSCSIYNNADLKSALIYDVKEEDGNMIYSLKLKTGGELTLTLMDKERYNLIINDEDSKDDYIDENIDYIKNIKPGNVVNVWLYENTNEIIRMEVKETIFTNQTTVSNLTDSGKTYGKLKIFTFERVGRTKNIYVSEDMANSLKTSEDGNYKIVYDSDFNILISTK